MSRLPVDRNKGGNAGMSSLANPKLGELCSFLNGGTPSKTNAGFFLGTVPWITGADITGPVASSARSYITHAAIDNSATNYVEAGTVLLVTRTSVGKVAVAGVDLCFSQDITAIKPDPKMLDAGYLVSFIRSKRGYFEANARGATIQGITRQVVADLPIPLPPLPEQERIAGILDKADGVSRKRKEALRLTDELLRSVFLEMFGDPVTNPKGWPEETSLGEVAELVSGITKGRQLNGKTTREVPYLAVANVQDRHLKLDAVKRIEATEEEIQRYKIRRNDLLLTEGGDPDKLGRGSLWREEIPECIHQNHIFRIRLTDSSIDPVFLNWLVGSSRGKRYFLRSAKQTTGIASINMTQLRAFPLLSPPVELQQKFSRIVSSVEGSTTRLQEALAQAEYYFAALQRRAFSGQL